MLPNTGSAGGTGDQEGVTATADPVAEVTGEVNTCAHRDPPGQVYVPLGPAGVRGEDLLCKPEKDADALQRDPLCLPF